MDIQDITIVAVAFGSRAVDDPITPVDETKNWNPIADLDKNGTIDIIDITMVAVDYGKTD